MTFFKIFRQKQRYFQTFLQLIVVYLLTDFKILQLVRIMLQSWWCVSTHTYVVSENIPFSTKTVLILLMSAFFGKKLEFFWQK